MSGGNSLRSNQSSRSPSVPRRSGTRWRRCRLRIGPRTRWPTCQLAVRNCSPCRGRTDGPTTSFPKFAQTLERATRYWRTDRVKADEHEPRCVLRGQLTTRASSQSIGYGDRLSLVPTVNIRQKSPSDLAVRIEPDELRRRHLRQARHGHDLAADRRRGTRRRPTAAPRGSARHGPVGAPRRFGSVEKEYCVFATQIGRWP